MGDDDKQFLNLLNIVYGDVIDRFADEYNGTLQLTEELGNNRSFVRLFAYHRNRICDDGGRLCSSGGCRREVYFSRSGGASWQSRFMDIREWCVIENLTICGGCNGDGGDCSISRVETSYVFNDLYSLRHSAGNIFRCPIYLVTAGGLFCCLPDDPAAGDYIVHYDNRSFETYQDHLLNSTIIPIFHRLWCRRFLRGGGLWRAAGFLRDDDDDDDDDDIEEE